MGHLDQKKMIYFKSENILDYFYPSDPKIRQKKSGNYIYLPPLRQLRKKRRKKGRGRKKRKRRRRMELRRKKAKKIKEEKDQNET